MDHSRSALGRPAKGFGVILAAVGLITLALVPLAGVASASATKPKISKLTASPKSVTSADGTVVLSGTVSNATVCTLSANLPVGAYP